MLVLSGTIHLRQKSPTGTQKGLLNTSWGNWMLDKPARISTPVESRLHRKAKSAGDDASANSSSKQKQLVIAAGNQSAILSIFAIAPEDARLSERRAPIRLTGCRSVNMRSLSYAHIQLEAGHFLHSLSRPLPAAELELKSRPEAGDCPKRERGHLTRKRLAQSKVFAD